MLHPPPLRLPNGSDFGPAAYAVGSELLELLLSEHDARRVPRYARLWDYYRNPILRGAGPGVGGEASAPLVGRVAQARGLPARLTAPVGGVSREIVVENDIAWRIHALIDFMVGKPVVIRSLADDPAVAAALTDYLNQTFEHNGGHGFFQDLALLGSIYGHVDVLLRPDAPSHDAAEGDPAGNHRGAALCAPARPGRLPPAAGPDRPPHPPDRCHAGPAVAQSRPAAGSPGYPGTRGGRADRGLDRRGVRGVPRPPLGLERQHGRASPRRIRAPPLGRLPVVHFQNLPQPLHFEGLSDVEPLIPLQDELNTRLSDRANRVTFQSFKMYLGRGIDGFADRPVGPGQMWSTDNPDASVTEFGGDAATPSEDAHIQQIREALDKASGVSPIAAGVVGGKVGNLSSENAIRIVLLGLVARIEKKRTAYGHGIARLCELILHSADASGRLPNRPEDRRVRLDWPEPFPDTTSQQVQNALAKQQLGVPTHQLLAELGYSDCPTDMA